MKRRALVLAFRAMLVVPAAQAQQPARVFRIGVTNAGFAGNSYVEALRQGLADLGWIEGRNIEVEYRFAEGRSDRYEEFVAQFVAMKVDVIVAGGVPPPVLLAAKDAIRTTPIVIPASYDPVGAGLVSSLARPGGNITGQAQLDVETTAKRMELVKLVKPQARVVAVLRDRGSVGLSHTDTLEATARALGLALQVIDVTRPEDLEVVFTKIREGAAEAVIGLASQLLTAYRKRVVELSALHRLIGVYENRSFVDAGGLLSYGPNFEELWRRSARFVDKVLKGAKPADIPVEQPTNFELAVNLSMARTLSVSIPRAVLLGAQHVIE